MMEWFVILVGHDEALQLWWMQCAALVLLMLYGFHLLECGWALTKHIPGIATKNTMMFLASSTAYTLVGHSLMYGDSWYGVCGRLGTLDAQYLSDSRFWFQTGFASVAATIISGAIVGRTTLFSNVIAAALIAGVIYPIHGHWVWHEDGFLHNRVTDYAGSGVVHIVGGTAAWIACLFAPLPEKGKPVVLPHGSKLQTSGFASGGVLLLIIGWIGFNGGSVTAPEKLFEFHVSHVDFMPAQYVQNTILAAAGGAAVAYVWSRIMLREEMIERTHDKPDIHHTFHTFNVLSGTMAGMVCVSACCNELEHYEALAVGAAGGLACSVCSRWMAQSKRIDTVDAVAVHLGGGVAGLFCAGVVVGGMGWQLLDVVLACAFTAANMAVACWILLTFPSPSSLLAAQGDWRGLTIDPDLLEGRKRLWTWALLVSVPIALIVPVLFDKWKLLDVVTILALLAPVVAVIMKLFEEREKLFAILRKPEPTAKPNPKPTAKQAKRKPKSTSKRTKR